MTSTFTFPTSSYGASLTLAQVRPRGDRFDMSIPPLGRTWATMGPNCTSHVANPKFEVLTAPGGPPEGSGPRSPTSSLPDGVESVAKRGVVKAGLLLTTPLLTTHWF